MEERNPSALPRAPPRARLRDRSARDLRARDAGPDARRPVRLPRLPDDVQPSSGLRRGPPSWRSSSRCVRTCSGDARRTCGRCAPRWGHGDAARGPCGQGAGRPCGHARSEAPVPPPYGMAPDPRTGKAKTVPGSVTQSAATAGAARSRTRHVRLRGPSQARGSEARGAWRAGDRDRPGRRAADRVFGTGNVTHILDPLHVLETLRAAVRAMEPDPAEEERRHGRLKPLIRAARAAADRATGKSGLE